MSEQMSIFDFIPIPEQSLEDMTDYEIAREIEERTGLQFWLNTRFGNYYETKVRGVTFYIYLERYDLDDNKNRFIGVGYDMPNGNGASAPCDSIAEAVSWIKRKTTDF